jgi:hypothetical protein
MMSRASGGRCCRLQIHHAETAAVSVRRSRLQYFSTALAHNLHKKSHSCVDGRGGSRGRGSWSRLLHRQLL